MTIFEYAIYRAAAQKMTPPEQERAAELAEAGDKGDLAAAWLLRRMVRDVLSDRERPVARRESAAAD